MKIQTSEKIQGTASLALFVTVIFFGFVIIPHRVIAQSNYQTMTIESMVKTYRDIENELLRRFELQVNNADRELTRTVQGLVYIRSRKAIPLLLHNIEVVPGSINEKVGDFYPVRMIGVGTYRGMYVMLNSLVSLGGIPLEQCVSELEKSQDGSLRETLLAHLGQELHGKAFVQEIRSRASSPNGKDKWGRLLSLLPHE